jgi:hypothetical protein
VEASGSVARMQLCKAHDGCLSETDDGKLHGSGGKKKEKRKKKQKSVAIEEKKRRLRCSAEAFQMLKTNPD